MQFLGSIVVSIPVCHTGDRGSIPRQGVCFLVDSCDMFFFYSATFYNCIEGNFGRRNFGKSYFWQKILTNCGVQLL